MLASALAACAVIVVASGCTQPSQGDGDRVAEWIDAQNWVTSASASVSTDPWSPGAGFTMVVDPSIPDHDLRDLAAASEKKAREAGWSDPYLVWEVGEQLSFSNADRAAFPVFTAMRADPRFLTASARGTGDCGNFYCVRIADASPTALHDAVTHLLALADAAGGVQENLEFDAVSADGRFAVSAEPDAAVDDAVALWRRIADEHALEGAHARVVQPVGDIPAVQLLDITVADEPAAAAAQSLAAAFPDVELTVTVSDRP